MFFVCKLNTPTLKMLTCVFRYHLSKNGTSAEKAEAYLRTLEGVRWHRHHNRTDVCQLLHGLHHVHIPHKKCHP